MKTQRLEIANELWAYNQLKQQEAEEADLIMGLGCRHLEIADRAVELYFRTIQSGRKGQILFSGGRGIYTRDLEQTEAARLYQHSIAAGVPMDALIVEDQSRHTGENMTHSRQLLRSMGITAIEHVQLVTMPLHERRALATLEKQWGIPGSVTSPRNAPGNAYEFAEFSETFHISENRLLDRAVDATEKIISYADRGWITPQPMDDKTHYYLQEARGLGLGSELPGETDYLNIPLTKQKTPRG